MGCRFLLRGIFHFLLQGIFLIQESNPGLLHCRQILYHLSYEGSPCSVPSSLPFADAQLQFSGSVHKPRLLGGGQACLLWGSGESDLRSVLPLPRFLVFLRYQCYYEYPLLTYLEYPILIAQGNRPPSPCPASVLSTYPHSSEPFLSRSHPPAVCLPLQWGCETGSAVHHPVSFHHLRIGAGTGGAAGVFSFANQFSSVARWCPTLCNSMDCSTPGLPVHHQLPEFAQTHVRLVSDSIQPSHRLSSPSPPAFNLSQHQGLFI